MLVLLAASPFLQAQSTLERTTRYHAEEDAVTGYNLPLYNNRPLYCNNTDAVILTGDKPFIRFIDAPYILGSFMAGIVHNGNLTWLVDCSDIKMEYRGSNTNWIISDTAQDFPVVKLSVLPTADVIGLSVKISVENANASDKLIWIYGGAQYKNNGWLSWDYDIAGSPGVGSLGFREDESTGNHIALRDGKFEIGPLIDSAKLKIGPYGITRVNPDTSVLVVGNCSDTSMMQIYKSAVRGVISLNKSENTFFWAVKPESSIKSDRLNVNPVSAWSKSFEKFEALKGRIILKTPDEKLNAMASVSAAAIDGIWYDSVYVHGGMLWNIPFPGWRTLFGGTVYGWHERVKREAHYYLSSQIKHSLSRYPKGDTGLLLTLQHKDSRFYGSGRINRDQLFYNFQSQFFDQLITEWRSTGDRELENILLPALKLHLEWEEQCFDPDGDGLYESYINTWPTDCQWYNGGATAEETAYAYKANGAAAEMAVRKGDTAAANFYKRKQQQIRKGFFSGLWIKEKGYAAAYREQGGYRRLHQDPWLYSIFLPVDVQLVNKEQAISSLYYTKYALQNDSMPAGGRKVWTSNWVPGIPTVRELYNGDNYHLALAYFLAGMADQGYDIMKGTFYEGAFNGKVPGDLGVSNGGTDFSDCSSMFARVLVEGLFGYRPDYPGNKVTLSPQLPLSWHEASIKTPDFSYAFAKTTNSIRLEISIARPAPVDLYLPLTITEIESVFLNDKPLKWELLPGYGQSILQVTIATTTKAIITVIAKDRHQFYQPVTLARNVGEKLIVKMDGAIISSISDEQMVLNNVNIQNGILYADVAYNTGFHTFFANVVTGKIPEKRVVYLFVADKLRARREESAIMRFASSNAEWKCIDIRKKLNADVRSIFQQQYLSPRANTVSARIGTDGYSPWTFLFWKYKAPSVELDSVQYLLKDADHIMTKQSVPFYWNGLQKNIAFTSLWDNWPGAVTVPVNQKGKAVWLMIAGSTNPMQCHIANAIVIFNYVDKSRDTLPLVPPVNYWSLCPYNIKSPSPGVVSRGDYTSETDRFVVPKPWPELVHLGQNCRAMLLNRRMKDNIKLESITLQTLSQEVVVGLMGVTIM